MQLGQESICASVSICEDFSGMPVPLVWLSDCSSSAVQACVHCRYCPHLRKSGACSRPMNEHSIRLNVDYAISDVHLDDFLEMDSSFTAEVILHYEGLIEANNWYGWSGVLALPTPVKKVILTYKRLLSLRLHRVRTSVCFSQVWSDLRIGVVPFFGLGAACRTLMKSSQTRFRILNRTMLRRFMPVFALTLSTKLPIAIRLAWASPWFTPMVISSWRFHRQLDGTLCRIISLPV